MTRTLGEIAGHIHAELHGDPRCEIGSIDTLENARAGAISFFSNRRYLHLLKTTRASAVILKADDLAACPVQALVVDNPYLGYARAARLLYPDAPHAPGIHPQADIHSSAKVSAGARVGPFVSVGSNTVIGENAWIGPGCILGKDVMIGADTRLIASVVICHGVVIGKRCILHPGVVIGADGFGIANDNGTWLKIPQVGGVIIGDDVEIGANTSIDRGALDNTVIEDGVKIDNQVQIGHNVRVGAHTAIAGCVGIAGSAKIGKRCLIGGAAGISGHLEIADDVTLMAMTGVANSIREPGVYASAIPAMDARIWRKNAVSFKHLHKLAARLNRLESKS